MRNIKKPLVGGFLPLFKCAFLYQTKRPSMHIAPKAKIFLYNILFTKQPILFVSELLAELLLQGDVIKIVDTHGVAHLTHGLSCHLTGLF